MLKATLYNTDGLSGTAFTSCEEGIYLIKSRAPAYSRGHEYIVLCKDMLTLNSFLRFCDSENFYSTQILNIKKVNPIFYKKYLY